MRFKRFFESVLTLEPTSSGRVEGNGYSEEIIQKSKNDFVDLKVTKLPDHQKSERNTRVMPFLMVEMEQVQKEVEESTNSEIA